jgi:DNA-binding transcriptional regulator/RsmH inhibitor MraZ
MQRSVSPPRNATRIADDEHIPSPKKSERIDETSTTTSPSGEITTGIIGGPIRAYTFENNTIEIHERIKIPEDFSPEMVELMTEYVLQTGTFEPTSENFRQYLDIAERMDWENLRNIVEMFICRRDSEVVETFDYLVAAYQYGLDKAARLLLPVVFTNAARFIKSDWYTELVCLGPKDIKAAQHIAIKSIPTPEETAREC